MVEKQNTLPELERTAFKISRSLHRVRTLIETPAGDGTWPKRFRLENLSGDNFLEQAIVIGEKVSSIKKNLTAKTLPTLEAKESEVNQKIQVIERRRQLVERIAGFVRDGVFGPEILEKAQAVLEPVPMPTLPSESTKIPATKSQTETDLIIQENEEDLLDLPNGKKIAAQGRTRMILKACIDASKNGRPASIEELASLLPKNLRSRNTLVRSELLRARQILILNGYEIINKAPKPQPGLYELREIPKATSDQETNITPTSHSPSEPASNHTQILATDAPVVASSLELPVSPAHDGPTEIPVLPQAVVVVDVDHGQTMTAPRPHNEQMAWNRTAAQQRRDAQIQEIRQQIPLDIARIVLSYFEANRISALPRDVDIIFRESISGMNLDLIAGGNKDARKNFFITSFANVVEEWSKYTNPRLIPERERKARAWLAEFKKSGHEIKELVQTVCRHFDIEIPSKYRDVQSPTAIPTSA